MFCFGLPRLPRSRPTRLFPLILPLPPLLFSPPGWLYDQTGSWGLALFAPSIFFFVTGAGGPSAAEWGGA